MLRNARVGIVGISTASYHSQVWFSLKAVLVNGLGALKLPIMLVDLGCLGWGAGYRRRETSPRRCWNHLFALATGAVAACAGLCSLAGQSWQPSRDGKAYNNSNGRKSTPIS